MPQQPLYQPAPLPLFLSHQLPSDEKALFCTACWLSLHRMYPQPRLSWRLSEYPYPSSLLDNPFHQASHGGAASPGSNPSTAVYASLSQRPKADASSLFLPLRRPDSLVSSVSCPRHLFYLRHAISQRASVFPALPVSNSYIWLLQDNSLPHALSSRGCMRPFSLHAERDHQRSAIRRLLGPHKAVHY